ncbi:hypothetical protein HJG60_007978 [Phyllostomus discolor]|uniref:Uncharacterized protein n=1 Tax=Phyllostomus discolor TaxID=89673 RepID=A0A834EYE0_9CHIR|nr:hypothetical protein HJG60_007978 [Phyllostomus discolor]
MEYKEKHFRDPCIGGWGYNGKICWSWSKHKGLSPGDQWLSFIHGRSSVLSSPSPEEGPGSRGDVPSLCSGRTSEPAVVQCNQCQGLVQLGLCSHPASLVSAPSCISASHAAQAWAHATMGPTRLQGKENALMKG